MKTIALSANYAYLDKAETTIKSILYNNQYVKIYLFNYDIPQEWFININKYVGQIGSKIIDAKFDPALLQNMHAAHAHINNMAYARFLIPKIVSEDKVLYLDSDLIVDSNLDELFNIDLENKSFLAVPDYCDGLPINDNYEFNDGVMLINNSKLKEDPELTNKLFNLSTNSNAKNGDQTILNQYFKGDIGTLPLKYNYQIGYDRVAFWSNNTSLVKLLNEEKNPVIIHYLMDDKPFNMISSGRLRDKWWFYRNLELSKIVQKFTIFDITKTEKNNFNKGNIFIFTRYAILQNIEELVKKLPHYQFHIAAWTGMGWVLEKLIKYPNVRLYPYIIDQVLDSLIEDADVYLDINYGNKADNVINRIEERNIPILSFTDTANQKSNYDKYKIYGNDQVDEMGDYIKNL